MLNTLSESGAGVSIEGLRSLTSAVDSTVRPYNVLAGYNLGNDCIVAAVPMHQFYGMSAVANEAGLAEAGLSSQPIAQRKLDPKHAFKLAVFMVRGLLETYFKKLEAQGAAIPEPLDRIRDELGRQPYFALQPIVVNISTCKPGGVGLKMEQLGPGYVKVYLSERDTLWVIDGQHRRFAMDMLFDFLDAVQKNHAYPKRGAALYQSKIEGDISPAELAVWQNVFKLAREECTVLIDVHLGLSPEQQRQLFHDLNNLGKKVEAGLAFQFDEANPVNLFIKEQLIGNGILAAKVVDKDITDWHSDEGTITRKELIAVNARLLLNKTTVSGAKPQEIIDRLDVAKEFWEAVSQIEDFGTEGAKRKTVAAQPVVLKAIAKIAYDYAFGRDKNAELLEKLLQNLEAVDFSHSNPMWRFYELKDVERKSYGLNGLAEYLPAEDGSNRDVGGWKENERVMRFGAKHNDIVPVLGDMIRWKLGLPNRHTRSADALAGTGAV